VVGVIGVRVIDWKDGINGRDGRDEKDGIVMERMVLMEDMRQPV